MRTRRQLLQQAALGAAMICSPYDLRTTSEGSRRSLAAETNPFQRPLRIPPVLEPGSRNGADYYEITMRAAKQEVIPGTETTIWGYDGIWPGPTIKARRDRPVHVRFANDLGGVALPEPFLPPPLEPGGVPTMVHMHGGNTPSDSDGWPHDEITTGGWKDFHYPNEQYAATHWYHDHHHFTAASSIYMGLAGFYLIEDPRERRLQLPSGEFDVPLMIQDRKFRPNGDFLFERRDIVPVGDVMIVNGRMQPYFEVARRKYRFRILNASGAREFELQLSAGPTSTEKFVQVGNDGGLLPAAAELSTLPLSQAERADIVIDFSRYEIGEQVTLQNVAPVGAPAELLRFDIVRDAEDDSAVPDTLRPIEELRRADAVRTREFTLDFEPTDRTWRINGKKFDEPPGRVDADPRLGDVEIWRITNTMVALAPIPHSFHMHLVRFQVLSRNGDPNAVAPGERGLKDTVRVGPGETVELITRFGDHRGKYVFHCHNLLHESNSMMGRFDVR